MSDVEDFDCYVLPELTESQRRQRALSDRASEVIGQKMLQGWTMLAEACTRQGCGAVPLMRAPRLLIESGSESDGQRCVVCGTLWNNGVELERHGGLLQAQQVAGVIANGIRASNGIEEGRAGNTNINPPYSSSNIRINGVHPSDTRSDTRLNTLSNTSSTAEMIQQYISTLLKELNQPSPHGLTLERLRLHQEVFKTVGMAMELAKRLEQ